MRVIGPRQERLDALLKWWKGRLRQMGYTGPAGAGDVIELLDTDGITVVGRYTVKPTTSTRVFGLQAPKTSPWMSL